MPTTSRGYPYPAPSDAPNGPAQIAALAEAIDDDVTAVALGLVPQQQQDSTDITGISSTDYIPGAPVVQVTFVAPASGRVSVTVTGKITQSNNGNQTQLGWIMREGDVVGSGTPVVDVSDDRAVGTGQSVNTGGPAGVTASNTWMKGSLTPGATYHVYTVHRTNPAGVAAVYYRHLLVVPCN